MCRAAANQTHCKLVGCTNPINTEVRHGCNIRHAFCSIVHAIRCGERPMQATAKHYQQAQDSTYFPPAPSMRIKSSKKYRSPQTLASPDGSIRSTPSLSSSPTLSAASSDDESVATVMSLDGAAAGHLNRMKKEMEVDGI
ncbi:hypothetical protein BGZ73_007114 [Actinomortierella ambigua]|nr:hypothetical protein BGZ73_007114 [Actinomortierella ambigua]